MPDTSVSELLGSRICHDLISPLGAIGNGLELLAMDGLGKSPEMALISMSVAGANARLCFFRIAFGAASRSQRLGAAEIRAILAGLYGQSRLEVNWLAEGACLRRDVRLAFLAVLCLESALPLGGTITVNLGEDGWRAKAEGARVRAEPRLWALLKDSDARFELSAALVQFRLLQDAAHGALSTRVDASSAEIGFPCASPCH